MFLKYITTILQNNHDVRISRDRLRALNARATLCVKVFVTPCVHIYINNIRFMRVCV